MRKLKFVKTVIPEIVSYTRLSSGEKIPDYRCPDCGLGVSDGDNYCSNCGSELDWEHVVDPVNQKFIRWLLPPKF